MPKNTPAAAKPSLPRRRPNKAEGSQIVATHEISKLLVNRWGNYDCVVVSPFGETLTPCKDVDFMEQFPHPRLLHLNTMQAFEVGKFFDVFPKLADDEVYLIVLTSKIRHIMPNGHDVFAEERERREKLLGLLPLAYDIFDENNILHVELRTRQIPAGRGRTRPSEVQQLVYNGIPPLDYDMVSLREKMLGNVTRAFNMSFMSPFPPTRSAQGSTCPSTR